MVLTLMLVATAMDVADGAAPGPAPTAHQLACQLQSRPSLLELAVRRRRGAWCVAHSP